MNRGNLTAADYYGLATVYRERTHIAVNTDDIEARDYAANLATQAYKDSMSLLLKSPGYGVDTYRDLGQNCDILSSYYYLAMLTSERGGGKAPSDLWDRMIMVHTSVRYLIDFIWTLCLYQIPDLEQHLHIITKVLPQGYNSRFDLAILTEDNTPTETKECINNILLDCSNKKRYASKDGVIQPVPEAETHLSPRDPRKLLELGNRAIMALMDCVEEISLYMSTVAKSGGSETEVSQGYVQLTEVPCPSVVTGAITGSKCPPLDASGSKNRGTYVTPPIAGGLPGPVAQGQQTREGYHPPPGQNGAYGNYRM